MIPILLMASVLAAPQISDDELKLAIPPELLSSQKNNENRYHYSWLFTSKAKVGKICSISVDENNQYKIKVRCKIYDTIKDSKVTIYVDIWMEKLDPNESDSWQISSIDILKITKSEGRN